MFQYPPNPLVGDLFNPVAGVSYRWSGTAWYLIAGPGAFITQTDADLRYIQLTEKGAPLGVATLDAGGKVPLAQLPPPGVFNDLVVSGNTTLGDNAADTLTVNAGTWTLGSNIVAARALGVAPAGTTNPVVAEVNFTGDPGGTTSITGFTFAAKQTGPSNFNALRGMRVDAWLSAPGNATSIIAGNFVPNVVGGIAGNITLMAGVESALSVNLVGTLDTGVLFRIGGKFYGAATAINNVYGFYSGNYGDATKVQNLSVIRIEDQTGCVVSTRGVDSNVTAGVGKYNLYIAGTAANFLAGDLIYGGLNTTYLTNWNATRAAGQLPAGATNVLTTTINASGDPGGATDAYLHVKTANLSGANPIVGAVIDRTLATSTVTGTIGSLVGNQSVLLQSAAAGSITAATGFQAFLLVNAAGNVNTYRGFHVNPISFSAAGVVTLAQGFFVSNLGHAQLSSVRGIDIVDQTPSTNAMGVRLQLSAGTGKYNIYADGTASSFISGSIQQNAATLNLPPAMSPSAYAFYSTKDSGIASPYGVNLSFYGPNTSPYFMQFVKGRGTAAAPAAGLNGDVMGEIYFRVHRDATTIGNGALIRGTVQGTPGVASNPGMLEFLTTPDGTTGLVSRMQIGAAGGVIIPNAGGNNPALTITAGSAALGFDIRGRVADNISTIRWMSNDGLTTQGQVNSDAGGNLTFYTLASVAQFQIAHNAAATAIPLMSGNVGFGTIGTSGGDLALAPVTNIVRFGAFTASGDVPVTGSVLIKDSGGTLRKLAVVA